MWRIYYRDAVVEGTTQEEWEGAPEEGVQVVVDFDPGAPLRWSCDGVPIVGRRLWTGEDTYNPLGWGVKYGLLLPDDEYWAIWRRACFDPEAAP